MVASFDVLYDSVDIFISFFVSFADFIFVRNIVKGCPGIGHSHGICGIYAYAFFVQQAVQHFCCSAGKTAEGNAGKNIVIAVFEVKPFDEISNSNGQTQAVNRTYKTDFFIGMCNEIEFFIFQAVCNEDCSVTNTFCNSVGGMSAVARSREIKNHLITITSFFLKRLVFPEVNVPMIAAIMKKIMPSIPNISAHNMQTARGHFVAADSIEAIPVAAPSETGIPVTAENAPPAVAPMNNDGTISPPLNPEDTEITVNSIFRRNAKGYTSPSSKILSITKTPPPL